MNTEKGVSPLKSDNVDFLKGYKQLLNFKYKISYLIHFPLNLFLTIAKDIYLQKCPKIHHFSFLNT